MPWPQLRTKHARSRARNRVCRLYARLVLQKAAVQPFLLSPVFSTGRGTRKKIPGNKKCKSQTALAQERLRPSCVFYSLHLPLASIGAASPAVAAAAAAAAAAGAASAPSRAAADAAVDSAMAATGRQLVSTSSIIAWHSGRDLQNSSRSNNR